MSVILSTRDNKFYVVPRSYLNYWEVFSSLQEATGCSEEDVIPVPPTSEEFDKWMEFVILFNSNYILSHDNGDEYVIDIAPPKRSDYEHVIRVMDPSDDRWKLYCIPTTDDVDLNDWFFKVGCLVFDDYQAYWRDDNSEGDAFQRSFMGWRSDYSSCIISLVRQQVDMGLSCDCLVLLGLLYTDWLNASCPYILDWNI